MKIRVSFSSPNATTYPFIANVHQVMVTEDLTEWWSNGDQVNGSPSMMNDNGRLKLQTDKIWSGAVTYPISVANKGKLHTLRFDAEVVQLNGAQVFIGVDESNDCISWNPIGNEVFRNAPVANQEYEVNFTPTKNYIRIYTSTWTATANISAPTEVYYDNFSISDGTTQPVTGGGMANKIAFRYRIHDVTIGRFLSTDPLEKKYPFYSPYHFSSNQPIHASEFEGLENVYDLNINDPNYLYHDEEGRKYLENIQGAVGIAGLGMIAAPLIACCSTLRSFFYINNSKYD